MKGSRLGVLALVLGLLAVLPQIAGAKPLERATSVATPDISLAADTAAPLPMPSMITLRDFGDGTSGLYLWTFDGRKLFRIREWRSDPGVFDPALARAMTAGDFTGDGLCDALVYHGTPGKPYRLYLFTNKKTYFSRPALVWESPSGTREWQTAQIAASDPDGDGICDAYIVARARPRKHAAVTGLTVLAHLLRFGHGPAAAELTLRAAHQPLAAESGQVQVADADGDGRDDLLLLYTTSPATSALLHFPAIEMATEPYQHPVPVAPGSALVAGDVDGDGRDEEVLLDHSVDQPPSVTLVRHEGDVAQPSLWWQGEAYDPAFADVRMAAGDVTGDGLEDALIACQLSPGVRVLLLAGGTARPVTELVAGCRHVLIGIGPPAGVPMTMGQLAGTIRDAANGALLEYATVAVEDADVDAETNPYGRYSFTLPAGEHTVTVSYPGRQTQSFVITVPAGQTSILDAALEGGVIG